ncbi:Uncharacterized iron-regulated membrane protein [uncultured Thiomicrorhabdus sp.]
MKPELPPAQTLDKSAELRQQFSYERSLQGIEDYGREYAAGARCWKIAFPLDRNEPYTRMFYRAADMSIPTVKDPRAWVMFDPVTGKPLEHRDTEGGQELYKMHWKLQYMSKTTGEWIVGVATLFMLIAIISGIIIHKRFFKDMFLFNRNKQNRSWLEAHKLVSVIALPFHLMITYTGLVFLMVVYMPMMIDGFYDSKREFRAELYDSVGKPRASRKDAELAPLVPMLQRAEVILAEKAPNSPISRACVRNVGDKNARVTFFTSEAHSPAHEQHSVVFNGVTGELIQYEPAERSAGKDFFDTMLGLHEGLFADTGLRWLYFFSGLLGTAMIGTGLVLWARKQHKKLGVKAANHRGLWWVDRMNVATVVGLPIAIGGYFLANRLLPIQMADRAEWEVHLLFIIWLLMLVHALLRSQNKVWFEQFVVAAGLFISLPIISAITTERGLVTSVIHGDWVFAGFDLTLLVVGALFAWAAHWRWQNRAPYTIDDAAPAKSQSTSKAKAKPCSSVHAAAKVRG